MLFDNIWKYSISESAPKVLVDKKKHNLISIDFINQSLPIRTPENIFDKGFQERQNSEGFGYGLFWTDILVSHYNELFGHDEKIDSDRLKIRHKQKIINHEKAEQTFSLRNIKV